ncbi:reverse transcriptase zinc-binding domain-containing protein [Tanacetum coccineum]
MVVDMIKNGAWQWPNEWKNEFPSTMQILVPNLEETKDDKLVWKNNNGKECKFSIRDVYKDMRFQSTKIKWAKLVWFSQCIPKQAFILWMVIQGKLMTCDRMAKWGSYNMTVCALCKRNDESHDHLFFNCKFSNDIWKQLKSMMQVQSNAKEWEDIINDLAEMPNKNNIWSIIRRLCLV